ncbi:MAG: pseudouridine synthase [Oscillospiraceae bacterium]
MLVDKKPGQAVHPYDGSEYGKTLIDHIQAYLYAKREWRPREENAFTPALCNRIDRNTGGIVIAAKTAEALRILNQRSRTARSTSGICASSMERRSQPPGR